MIPVLAIAFLVMFPFDADGALACLKCLTVERNNNCRTVERVCRGGAWVFCYTRMIIREQGRTKVDRGCTTACRSVKKKKKYRYEEIMQCCEKDLCNNSNIWLNIE